MRRWWLGLFVLPAFAAFFACGGGQQTPDTASSDVCPVVDVGPPVVCPEGCTWDGEECRKHSGIIVFDSRDGGRPQPIPQPGPR